MFAMFLAQSFETREALIPGTSNFAPKLTPLPEGLKGAVSEIFTARRPRIARELAYIRQASGEVHQRVGLMRDICWGLFFQEL